MPTERIATLWFDYRGYGPSDLCLELQPTEVTASGAHVVRMTSLGMRVRLASDGMVMPNDRAMVDGGFLLPREEVEKLHAQLGAWLEATRP